MFTNYYLRGNLTSPDKGSWGIKTRRRNPQPMVTLASHPFLFLFRPVSSLLAGQNPLTLLVRARMKPALIPGRRVTCFLLFYHSGKGWRKQEGILECQLSDFCIWDTCECLFKQKQIWYACIFGEVWNVYWSQAENWPHCRSGPGEFPETEELSFWLQCQSIVVVNPVLPKYVLRGFIINETESCFL